MSILIKDMEMPSCCGGCGFSDWSNLHQTLSCSKHYFEPCFADHSKEYMEKRADFCPLIEIPELPPVPSGNVCVNKKELEELISKQIKDLLAYAENGVNDNGD